MRCKIDVHGCKAMVEESDVFGSLPSTDGARVIRLG
jgi:hypothetical protein